MSGQSLKDTSLAVTVVAPEDVPADVWSGDWSSHSLGLDPLRISDTLRTPRWRHGVVTATRGDRVVGFLPVSRTTGDDFPADIFDPRAQVPDLAGADRGARDYLLVGGHFDLASGCAVRSDLRGPDAAHVRRAVARAAFDHARDEGLTGVALYVADAERAEWDDPDAPYAGEQVTEFATIELAEPTRECYLASLRHSRRSVVVRDERELDRQGLRATAVTPDDVLAEAAPLIVDVKANHGEVEHPQLVEYRLERWIRQGAGTPVAFVLRDGRGTMLAVSLGRHHGDVIEMYEIGLRAGIPGRGLAYAEVLVYAPLRHAFGHGCTRLRLGCDSIHPKRLRGANVTPVWALASSGG